MSMFSIAYNNFKNNIKTYTMFFISMVFSVIILSNFLILMDGESLKYLGELNAEYVKIMIQVISVILAIFMFFFIWYSSNIFLRNRKKEIGIYTFMGLDSVVIGKIYFLEMMLIGLTACVIGTSIGVLLSKFFQMIVFAIADFNLDIKFNITPNAIFYTIIIFMSIFIFMSIKGFVNINRSKVIELLNDSKKTEKMPRITVFTYIIASISVVLIGLGYYLVTINKTNAIKTLLLVCIGTYGLFYAMIPAILNSLINKKSILYKGENIITINNLAYRIKKNYTTYATISILTACTISVLGTAVSMRALYKTSVENDELYTMSFYSVNNINDDKFEEVITKVGNKNYELKTTVLRAKSTLKDAEQGNDSDYIVLSYSQFINILKENGNEESLSNVNDEMVKGDNVIYIQRPGTLASLIQQEKVRINDIEYNISESSIRFKTLGSLLNYETIIVNNEEYEKIKVASENINFYGIKIDNEKSLLDENIINSVLEEMTPYVDESIKAQVGLYESEKITWLKFVYAIGAFLFLVFVLAEASIIYIKIYSDANEDKNKYNILLKIGASKKDLRRTIRKEVSLFYIIPLVIGLVHSYFAIDVLGRFLSENLIGTYLLSIITCSIIFIASCIISIMSFKKVVNVK